MLHRILKTNLAKCREGVEDNAVTSEKVKRCLLRSLLGKIVSMQETSQKACNLSHPIITGHGLNVQDFSSNECLIQQIAREIEPNLAVDMTKDFTTPNIPCMSSYNEPERRELENVENSWHESLIAEFNQSLALGEVDGSDNPPLSIPVQPSDLTKGRYSGNGICCPKNPPSFVLKLNTNARVVLENAKTKMLDEIPKPETPDKVFISKTTVRKALTEADAARYKSNLEGSETDSLTAEFSQTLVLEEPNEADSSTPIKPVLVQDLSKKRHRGQHSLNNTPLGPPKVKAKLATEGSGIGLHKHSMLGTLVKDYTLGTNVGDCRSKRDPDCSNYNLMANDNLCNSETDYLFQSPLMLPLGFRTPIRLARNTDNASLLSPALRASDAPSTSTPYQTLQTVPGDRPAGISQTAFVDLSRDLFSESERESTEYC